MIINPYQFATGGAPWIKGFNFRATSGYVTDGADETYVVGDSYPTTRNGVTFGWESGFSIANIRNRDNTIDRRLAGMNFDTDANAIFRVDLPSTGNFSIRLALGDVASSNDGGGLLKDDTTTVLTVTVSTASSFKDTTGTSYLAGDWPADNDPASLSFASTILRWHNGSGTNCIAHLYIEKL